MKPTITLLSANRRVQKYRNTSLYPVDRAPLLRKCLNEILNTMMTAIWLIFKVCMVVSTCRFTVFIKTSKIKM